MCQQKQICFRMCQQKMNIYSIIFQPNNYRQDNEIQSKCYCKIVSETKFWPTVLTIMIVIMSVLQLLLLK